MTNDLADQRKPNPKSAVRKCKKQNSQKVQALAILRTSRNGDKGGLKTSTMTEYLLKTQLEP